MQIRINTLLQGWRLCQENGDIVEEGAPNSWVSLEPFSVILSGGQPKMY